MSEPIIIETTTTTRERLVLVPVDACSEVREGDPRAKLGAKVGLTVLGTYARDATAADLERAGWVRDGDLLALTVRAEKAERERDDLLGRISDAEEAARCRGRERDTLRAELARLTAPGEGSEDGGPWRAYGEPTDQELVDAFEHAYRNAPSVRTHATAIRTIYRLGVAHERARQQPEKDRALALAARVRQERCLVAEAVGMGTGVTISRTSERVPGTTGMWDVYVTRRPDVPGEHYAYGVPTAGVPATLARLLGEVSRG